MIKTRSYIEIEWQGLIFWPSMGCSWYDKKLGFVFGWLFWYFFFEVEYVKA